MSGEASVAADDVADGIQLSGAELLAHVWLSPVLSAFPELRDDRTHVPGHHDPWNKGSPKCVR